MAIILGGDNSKKMLSAFLSSHFALDFNKRYQDGLQIIDHDGKLYTLDVLTIVPEEEIDDLFASFAAFKTGWMMATGNKDPYLP